MGVRRASMPVIVEVVLSAHWEPNASRMRMASEAGTVTLTYAMEGAGAPEGALVFSDAIGWRYEAIDDRIELHRYGVAGLEDVLWLGEVLDSDWVAALHENPHLARRQHHHFILPCDEGIFEVVASGFEQVSG